MKQKGTLMYIDKDRLTLSRSNSESVSAAQLPETPPPASVDSSAGNSPGFAPISPDTPSWGPPPGDDSPGFAPISPDTPSWGPPPGSSCNPSWGCGIIGGGSIIITPGQNPGNRSASIRFLHAASNQPAVDVSLGGQMVIRNMQYGNSTPYYVDRGSQSTLVTVTNAQTGQTLYRRYINFANQTAYTVSIINDGSGISLFTLTDMPCNYRNSGCLRAVNLSSNSGPVDIFLSGYGRIFQRVGRFDSTGYLSINQGTYRASVSEALPCTSNSSVIVANDYAECNNTRIAIMDTTTFNLMNTVSYTLYIIGMAYQFPALQILPLESDLVY